MKYANVVPATLRQFMLDPTIDHLKNILLQNTGETDFLDFKSKWIDMTKLAKHVLAISNSGGGCIIVGVSQQDDGTPVLDGLKPEDILDKADVDNKLEHLLPKYIKYRTEDFTFSQRTHDLLKGKTFQVLIIEYDPKYVPYTSVINQGELKYGAIYIRQGTKSIEASNEKLVEIILRKVQAGGSSVEEFNLRDHLQQLNILIDELHSDHNEEYIQFLQELIEEKKNCIRKYLQINKSY
ncbi:MULTISPECIES: AlbA family DNA-binding domain-containing protein [Bacillus]|uniref:AlbA family DNA-binding domain-containing protein n=1 Tax=Bacillus TaxID=1386 RepID=UPI0002F0EB71|nr:MULTISPECIES: ATP-binding protein [Bacillus]